MGLADALDVLGGTVVGVSGRANWERLPLEIRTSDRCVVWRFELRRGRDTKPPYQPRHPEQRASVASPSTWGTFDEALAAVTAGDADGVGVVLGAGLVGIDLDHVRDPSTGTIAEWARRIVAEVASYTETSPSGTGLHILARGKLPSGGRRRGPFEMYESERYFTVTGEHLAGTPLAIHERTRELAALHARMFGSPEPAAPRGGATVVASSDTVLIERAHRARNGSGTRFASLWRGNFTGYRSQSEADLALCAMLMFWTKGDVARVDRLFRQSGLMRPKWDAGTPSYGARTIGKAAATTRLRSEATA